MADYRTDAGGVVHLMLPLGDGEFTMCGLPTDGDDFIASASRGPCSCRGCREAWVCIKSGISGAKWSDLVKEPTP
jgi:hypothetical protein